MSVRGEKGFRRKRGDVIALAGSRYSSWI